MAEAESINKYKSPFLCEICYVAGLQGFTCSGAFGKGLNHGSMIAYAVLGGGPGGDHPGSSFFTLLPAPTM